MSLLFDIYVDIVDSIVDKLKLPLWMRIVIALTGILIPIVLIIAVVALIV